MDSKQVVYLWNRMTYLIRVIRFGVHRTWGAAMTSEYRSRFRRRRWPPTVRFQLLVIVNSAMAILIAAFLFLDYRREINDSLAQKQVALQEEAKTLLPAILLLRERGTEAVQSYLDAVCARMRDAESPRHHIAVSTSAGVVQSMAHGRSSPEMFRAMKDAASVRHQSAAPGELGLIVGSAAAENVSAYVAEDAINVYRSVLGQVLWRLAGMVVLGAIAAVLVSTILLRTIVRPINHLVDAVAQISHGNFGVRAGRVGSREFNVLSSAIDSMSEALRLRARERQGEMARAREIQEHLLPASAVVPGMRLAVLYNPATEVAGDYYDVLPLRDGSWLLCVADVCGHGVPAAMSAAMLKALLTHAAEHHVRPDELLRLVNERFCALSPPGLFASMLLLRWQPENRVLQYASAGHEPGCFMARDGAASRFEATGLVLGVDPTASWTLKRLSPHAGERLLMTTDGVAEAMNPQGELFGRERLRSLMSDGRGRSLEELVSEVDTALLRHQGGGPPSDDATLLAVEFVPRAFTNPVLFPSETSGSLSRTHEQGALH